jgi:hypothetical protein
VTGTATKRPARVTCTGCRRDRTPHGVSETGWICSTCAAKRRPTEPCSTCGREALVIARNADGRGICNRCYIASRKTPCSVCGAVRRVITRTATGDPLCRACAAATKPPRECVQCSRVGDHQVHDSTGRPLCHRCWKRQEQPCARCGVTAAVAVRFVAGPICTACLHAALAAPTTCGQCGAVRPDVGPDNTGSTICPPCAGLRFKFQCPSCQKFTWPLVKGGSCGQCRDDATAHRRAERFSVTPTLDDYDRQVQSLLDAVPDPARVVVRRYARWAVTRPLQHKLATGKISSRGSTRWPMTKVKVAARFTAATSELGLALADVTQTHLDSWLAEFPSQRPALRAYVRWCARHRYMSSDLQVLAASSRDLRHTLDDDTRLALAEGLLRPPESNDDPSARLAALLVVLFGQKTTDVAATPTNAVRTTQSGHVELLLGYTAIRLREPIASLALDTAAAATRLGSPWLFPSTQTGSHLSAGRLSERMRKLGVPHLLLARNAARAALAEHMPPAMLADRLACPSAPPPGGRPRSAPHEVSTPASGWAARYDDHDPIRHR